jgi:hypothetical protein
MKTTTGKNILPKLKAYLLQGKSISHNQALRRFGTNRLSEYVRRLRHYHQMTIETKMVIEGEDSYAVYSIPKEKKENRIKQLYA